MAVLTAVALTAAVWFGAPADPSVPQSQDRVVIVVVDGLRPDYISAELMPRLNGLAQRGVRGLRHHAVFPTVTRVNAASISTGQYPAGHGMVGNTVYVPEVNADRALSSADVSNLRAIDEATQGQLLTAPSLGELLTAQGLVYFAASSGSGGSAVLLNHRGAGAGLVHHDVTIPDTLAPVATEVLGPTPTVPDGAPAVALVARAVDAVLRMGIDRADADVVVVWLTEPDGTAHEHGVGSSETTDALRRVDGEIGRLLDGLAERGVLANTNVLVTSDHGFSTRVGTQSLEDLLVESGLKASPGSADVIVAGGALHVREGGSARVEQIVRLLQATDWIGPVFTRAREAGSDLGQFPGTLSFSAIGWDHARRGDVLAVSDWTDTASPWGYPGSVLAPGVAGHGTSSPWDIRAAFVAAGPAIREGVVTEVPSGNIDLMPTALHLVGAPVPARVDGRVLTEVLRDGPSPSSVSVTTEPATADVTLSDVVYRVTAERSRVGNTVYLDGTTVERSVVPTSSESGTLPDEPLTVPDYTPPEVRRLRATTLRVYEAPEADQGVAADARFFYPVDNTVIAKYEIETGRLMDRWVGPRDGLIRHMNSCLVRSGRIWCANSNYSLTPMGSSIEVFDAGTLEHVQTHSLGMLDEGSLTWVDDDGDGWIAGFAHYDESGGLAFKDHAFSSVATYDTDWRRTGGWLFPESVLARMAPHAASGGAIGPDGWLYLLGHDRPELYVVARPPMGPTLVHIATIELEAEGQAFSWAQDGSRTIFAIDRRRGLVRQIQVPPVSPADPASAVRFRAGT